jgi:hypothetical protein
MPEQIVRLVLLNYPQVVLAAAIVLDGDTTSDGAIYSRMIGFDTTVDDRHAHTFTAAITPGPLAGDLTKRTSGGEFS